MAQGAEWGTALLWIRDSRRRVDTASRWDECFLKEATRDKLVLQGGLLVVPTSQCGGSGIVQATMRVEDPRMESSMDAGMISRAGVPPACILDAREVEEPMTYILKSKCLDHEAWRRGPVVGREEGLKPPGLVQVRQAVRELWPELDMQMYKLWYSDEDCSGHVSSACAGLFMTFVWLVSGRNGESYAGVWIPLGNRR